jgi:hypothetical protein
VNCNASCVAGWVTMDWRHVRTRRRELIALGVPPRQAARHARSRKGPWHMAKTIASGVGMTNAWLKAQGVLSLKTLWAELAHLRCTARCGPACRGGVGRGAAMTTLTRFICPLTSTGQIPRFCEIRFKVHPSEIRPIFRISICHGIRLSNGAQGNPFHKCR